MYARTTDAVPSGRSVSRSPPRSSNVYVSFSTMSVTSPMPRANTRASSNCGVSIRPYPNSAAISDALRSNILQAGWSSGKNVKRASR